MIQAQTIQRNFVFVSLFEEVCPCCHQEMIGEVLDRRCTNTAGCDLAKQGIVITGKKMAGELYDQYHPDGI